MRDSEFGGKGLQDLFLMKKCLIAINDKFVEHSFLKVYLANHKPRLFIAKKVEQGKVVKRIFGKFCKQLGVKNDELIKIVKSLNFKLNRD